MGRPIREDDSAETVVDRAQQTPSHEIGRAKNAIRARRPRECKLECSNRLLQPDELNRQWIGEHGDTLIPQSRDTAGQIDIQIRRYSERFGQNEGGERIGEQAQRDQVCHVRGQREAGQEITDDEKPDQIGQARRQAEAGEVIPAKVE